MAALNKKPSIWQKSCDLLTVLSFLISSCTSCPKSKYGDLLANIPSMENKNIGRNLKGWEYKTIISKETGETHYYYHMPSNKPMSPTFVFIHGMFLDGKSFFNFRSLADDFELVAYDLPYESPFYKGNTSDFAHLFADFLKTMDLKQIYLGGVSLGGQIAMIFVEQHKEIKVDGLVLISTDLAKTRKELRSSRRVGRLSLRITDGDDEKAICLVKKLSDRKKRNAKQDSNNVFDIFSLKRPSFYHQAIQSTANMDRIIRFDAITCPTLIIHGDCDSTVPIEKARGLLDHIPNAEFVVFKGGEHDIVYTEAEEMIEHIKNRFLANP